MALIVICSILAAGPGWEVQAQSNLTFEVASIKHKEGPVTGGSVRFLPGGRFERISATISDLLSISYPGTRGEIVGVPEWVYTERDDVIASAGREATRDDIALMMRALLEVDLNCCGGGGS